MGKPYIYTRIFKPLGTYDHKFWIKLETNLFNYTQVEKSNPIEETKFSETHWYFPFQSKPRKDLCNIIILIAKITGTKIMWKQGINWDNTNLEKHFLIIGENTRVIICRHILNYTIEGILRYEDYLKKKERERSKVMGYKTIREYIQLKESQKLYRILYMGWPLINQFKINRLENYIMGRYKLDYKRYGQENNAYYNAISKEFHPKRMML